MLIEALRYTNASEESEMTKTFKAAIAAAALIGAASGARADLTSQGAVGLPLNPTAQIPEEGGIRLQANYNDLGDIKVGGASALGLKSYGIFAAGRVASKFEISGGVSQLRYKFNPILGVANTNDTGISVGAKYLFTKETDPAGVRLAAGAGYDDTQAKDTYGYLVATKYLGKLTEGKAPVTGHLGVRYDRFKNSFLANKLGAPSSSYNKVSAYAGLEVPFSNGFEAVGEIESKRANNGSTPYSISLRYRPKGSAFGGSIGWARNGLSFGGKSPDGGVFAQLGYTFDTKK